MARYFLRIFLHNRIFQNFDKQFSALYIFIMRVRQLSKPSLIYSTKHLGVSLPKSCHICLLTALFLSLN